MSINGFNIQAVMQQYLQQLGLNLPGLVNGNNGFAGLNQTAENQTIDNNSDKTPETIQQEIDELREEKRVNNQKKREIKAKIRELTADVKRKTREADKIKKEEIAKYKNEADKIKEENLKAYQDANKDGGEGMTFEELQKNIKKSMPDAPNFAKYLALKVVIEDELDQIDTLNDELDQIDLDIDVIDQDIKVKEDAKAQAAQQQTQQQTSNNGDLSNLLANAGFGNTAGDGGGGYSYEQQIADLKASNGSANAIINDMLGDNNGGYTTEEYNAAVDEASRTEAALEANN